MANTDTDIELPGRKAITSDGISGGYNSIDTHHLTDTRKPKLSLRDLNRLKHIQRIKTTDSEEKNKLIGRMYAPPPSDEDMGM